MAEVKLPKPLNNDYSNADFFVKWIRELEQELSALSDAVDEINETLADYGERLTKLEENKE